MLVFFDGYGEWVEKSENGDAPRTISPRGRYPGVYRLPPDHSRILKHTGQTKTQVLLPAIGHPDAPSFQINDISHDKVNRVQFDVYNPVFASFGSSDIIPEEPTPQTQTYLDQNHEMHSEELAIAIATWQAVLECKPPKPNRGSRKRLIEDHLRKHHSLTEQAITRIATMLNPDKEGGSPSSQNNLPTP